MTIETKENHNGMKVGDLITTYHKGFWVLEKIQVRRISIHELSSEAYKNKNIGDEYSPLFFYKKAFDEKGKLSKKGELQRCDSFFCQPAKNRIEQLRKEIDELEKTFNNWGK